MTAVETVWVDYEALMHEREQRQDDDEELPDGRERLGEHLPSAAA